MLIVRDQWSSILIIAVLLSFLCGCTDAKLKALIKPFPTITLEIQNYCPFYDPNTANRRNFVFRDIFVYNSSAYFDGTNWSTDFDRDGLSDKFELDPANVSVYPISWTSAYTLLDGYSDLVKVRSGIQIGTTMPGCGSYTDTDGDGLTDCEENFLGLQTNNPDTDGDGISDYLELRFGMNALDPNDPFNILVGDGFTDYQKVKWGVNVRSYVTSDSATVMLNYKTTPTVNPVYPQLTCYTFDISNIPVLPVVNGNSIQIQVVEDNQYPATSGLNPLDREVRNHQVMIPQTIKDKVTVIIPDGIDISNSMGTQGNSGLIEGVDRPLIVVGGGS